MKTSKSSFLLHSVTHKNHKYVCWKVWSFSIRFDLIKIKQIIKSSVVVRPLLIASSTQTMHDGPNDARSIWIAIQKIDSRTDAIRHTHTQSFIDLCSTVEMNAINFCSSSTVHMYISAPRARAHSMLTCQLQINFDVVARLRFLLAGWIHVSNVRSQLALSKYYD